MNSVNHLTQQDISFLNRCLELAEEALNAGDKPFGSILVNEKGEILAEARNRVNEKNVLAHPEFELSHWALEHLTLDQRKKSTLYTSGEHCAMCAGAHAWSEIGTVVYISSGEQLGQWLTEFNIPESNIRFLPIQHIVKNIQVKGPAEGDLLERIKQLHLRYYTK